MFAAILQDEPQQPLALVPLTEEEQVRNINTHKHASFIVESFFERKPRNVGHTITILFTKHTLSHHAPCKHPV